MQTKMINKTNKCSFYVVGLDKYCHWSYVFP